MTREEAIIKAIKTNGLFRTNYNPKDVEKVINKAIKVLEHEPCEDAISRKAVEDAIYDYSRACDVNEQQIMEYIDKLPPIQPRAKVGKWIKYGRPRCGEQHYQCTICNEYFNLGIYSDYYLKAFKFCPNCGAKMEVE